MAKNLTSKEIKYAELASSWTQICVDWSNQKLLMQKHASDLNNLVDTQLDELNEQKAQYKA